MPFSTRIRASLLVLLAIAGTVLTGCEHLPPPAEPAYTNPDEQAAAAERELARALTSASPQKELHQLAAANIYRQLGDQARAEAILSALNPAALPLASLADYSLGYSAIAIAKGEYQRAHALLTNPYLEQEASALPAAIQAQWRQRRGELFAMMGAEGASIGEYMALDRLPDVDIAANHEIIWAALNRLDDGTFAELGAGATDDDFKGWYQLAQVSRDSRGNLREQNRRFHLWLTRWPQHPAARVPPAGLAQLAQVDAKVLRQVALLLPLRGTHGLAGITVRDGFLAAWYDFFGREKSAPALRLYDTTTGDVNTLYRQAVAEGADIAVGPLRKEELVALAANGNLPIPVIGLNYLAADAPAAVNLYQFGLSITDEATQAAERAWLEGRRTALTIAPATPWGQSALDAFRERWLSKGGTLVSSPAYPPQHKDFTALLRPILQAGVPPPTAEASPETPRRRQDIDMVFLVAYPEQARQIKPALNFLFAADLPVYATSVIYPGEDDPGSNRDLNDIRFVAMPWALPASQAALRERANRPLPAAYRPLFALGADAFLLQQWLPALRGTAATPLYGHTGTLMLGPQYRVIREQPWAEFHDGRVRAAAPLPEFGGE